MKEKNQFVQLNCLIHSTAMEDGDHRLGILTKNNASTYNFVEAAMRKSYTPNPKLYDGNYVSLVRQKDGRFRLNIKQLNLSPTMDQAAITAGIVADITNALKIVCHC